MLTSRSPAENSAIMLANPLILLGDAAVIFMCYIYVNIALIAELCCYSMDIPRTVVSL